MPRLLVVATPIGNLNDLTERVRAALTDADLIAAEDTRVTMKLLTHYDIKKPLLSCHRHNEGDRAEGIVARMLEEDLTVALTCDAGTPGISDPGHILVDACWRAGIPVEPICGPTAVATAISASGFDAREFAFFGFPPREKKALREKLDSILQTRIPVFVLYESPHRVIELVQTIAELWPDARLLVASDLSKRFERLYRGAAADVLGELQANANADKGEYCLVCDVSAVPIPAQAAPTEETAERFALMRLLEGDDLDEAFAAARDAGFPRNEIYRAKLKIRELFE